MRIGPWRIVRVVAAPVSEYEAYTLYLAHLRTCPPCRARHAADGSCVAGVTLHDQWKRAERAEAVPVQPVRRRRRVAA